MAWEGISMADRTKLPIVEGRVVDSAIWTTKNDSTSSQFLSVIAGIHTP